MPGHHAIGPEERRLVELLLTSADPREIKRGLQRACEHLERGRLFVDPSIITLRLPTFFNHIDVKVRRWAYKLSVLIEDSECLQSLWTSLEREKDPENRTWAISAYFGLASRRAVEKLIAREKDEFFNGPMQLAAALFDKRHHLSDYRKIDLKVFDQNPLAQKWLCLLCGYSRTLEHSVSKKFDDLELARNLVGHDDTEIVEYSVWAMHRHPTGSPKLLLTAPRDLIERTEPNVRRWVYRLITKNQEIADSYKELISSGIETENVSDAKEGLALGLAGLDPLEIDEEVIRWIQTERSEAVRIALVDHFARGVSMKASYEVTLVDVYATNIDNVLLRQKIEASTAHLPALREKLRKIAVRVDGEVGQLGLFTQDRHAFAHNGTTIIVAQEVHMTNNTTSLTVSGSGNTVTGNVLNSQLRDLIVGHIDTAADAEIGRAAVEIKAFTDAIMHEKAIDDAVRSEILGRLKDLTDPAKNSERRSIAGTLWLITKGLLSLSTLTSAVVIHGGALLDILAHMKSS